MSLLFALALQAATAESGPQEEPEILVIATKLEKWKGKFSLRGEKLKCKTVISTGDKAIDAIGCKALLQCITPLQPRLTESDNKALGEERQRELKKAIFEDLSICVKDTRTAMVVDFVAQRKANDDK